MEVEPGGLATNRGVDTGDLILDVADHAIAAPEDVYRLVNTAKNAGKRSVLMRIKSGDIAKFIAPGLFQAIAPAVTDVRSCDGNDAFAGALLLRDTPRRGFRRERRGCRLCRPQDLGMIVDHPLRIVCKVREASFEPLKFTHLVGIIRHA